MEVSYRPIVSGIAKEYKLTLLDLANTFDIHDQDLYTQQIEPTAAGGTKIAELIEHAVLRPPNAESVFLRLTANDQLEETTNTGTWTVQPVTDQDRAAEPQGGLSPSLVQMVNGLAHGMVHDPIGTVRFVGSAIGTGLGAAVGAIFGSSDQAT